MIQNRITGNRGGREMSVERFTELVRKNNGFEIVHAFRDDEDHYIGGKGSTCWYIIMKKGKIRESFIGTNADGVWKDIHIKGNGSKKKTLDMPSGSTVLRISEKAYYMQEEKWVKDRKGKLIQDSHPHLHYVYGFGDKGLDVSEQYGVTIAYSDIKDVSIGFHLRNLWIGEEVTLPDHT